MSVDAALAHAKNRGADECEIVAVKKNTTTVRITDSGISEIKQNRGYRCGIRLIRDKKIAAVQTDYDGLLGGVDWALCHAPLLQERGFWRGLPHKAEQKDLPGTFDRQLECMSGSDAADIAESMINGACGSAMTVTGSLNIVSEEYTIANSNGLEYKDRSTYISGVVNSESERGHAVSGIGHSSGRTLSGFSAEQAGDEAKIMCKESANPRRVEPGRYSIIFEPYAAGELLAFVAAPNFALKAFSEKKSCLSEMGEKMAYKSLHLADDPHMPEGMGTRHVDDEGVKTQKTDLIRDGVFCGVISDLYDGYKENLKSTGNASRAGSPLGRSSEPVPVSAPHNLCVTPGDMSHEEMISDTRHGLLVGRLWYTYAVNPTRGDFSCTARSGIRIIENGQVRGSGKQVRIMHNLLAMMRDISGIGNRQRRVIQWASLPSSTPPIRVEGIHAEPV
ncbi:MAG: TldD/PmbA family protein [Nitrosopumilus sp. B06]|nr:MAG: TldD/PmbA family protein [Nitrosopumilus sp. B06]